MPILFFPMASVPCLICCSSIVFPLFFPLQNPRTKGRLLLPQMFKNVVLRCALLNSEMEKHSLLEEERARPKV